MSGKRLAALLKSLQLHARMVLVGLTDDVVAHDKELHQHVLSSRANARKDRVERRHAIDQQIEAVLVRKVELDEMLQGREARQGRLRAGLPVRERLAQLGRHSAQPPVARAPRLVVAHKLAPPKQRVHRHRDKRLQDQRHDPSRRTLRRARVKERAPCAVQTDQLDRRNGNRNRDLKGTPNRQHGIEV